MFPRINRLDRRTAMLAALLALVASGCGGFTDKVTFTQTDQVSNCGGFAKAQSPLLDSPPAYCDAEVLHWTYARDTETLELDDARVVLNCCGDHHMSIAWKDGLYVATETDEPQQGGARCSCDCVFDFSVSAKGIPKETILLQIHRQITDWPDASGTKFDGSLDLATGSGFVILDTSPTEWCQTP